MISRRHSKPFFVNGIQWSSMRAGIPLHGGGTHRKGQRSTTKRKGLLVALALKIDSFIWLLFP
jgi:hypothetical protein